MEAFADDKISLYESTLSIQSIHSSGTEDKTKKLETESTTEERCVTALSEKELILDGVLEDSTTKYQIDFVKDNDCNENDRICIENDR